MEVIHVVLVAVGVLVAVLTGTIGYAVGTARESAELRARVRGLEEWRKDLEGRIAGQLDEIKNLIEARFQRLEEITERLVRVEAKQEDSR